MITRPPEPDEDRCEAVIAWVCLAGFVLFLASVGAAFYVALRGLLP
jgi:hypothetical protein